MKSIYLDSSFYISLLHKEVEFHYDSNIQLCTSLLTFFETERTLIRFARENKISNNDYSLLVSSMNKDIEKFLIKNIDFDLYKIKQFPLVRTPKTADSIHLKSALWFKDNGGLDLFLTLDQSQAESAQELGLEVRST